MSEVQAVHGHGKITIPEACIVEINRRIEAQQPGEFQVGCDKVTLTNTGGEWLASISLYHLGMTVTYPEPVVEPTE